MSDERKDLPPANAPNFAERVREAMSTYLGKRGDPLDRGLTVRDLYEAGMIELSPNYLNRPGSSVPVLGPGPNVGSEELDYTPPPTPTGLTVTATFANLIIEHDNPVYPQGHLKTVVYGAIGTAPVFSDAEVITEFTGTVFAHPVSLGQQWHIWIKWVSKAGVASALPAGGTNGVSATVGKIGHSDLGPLIVEADNLASGAVTASKVAANAIDLTKFANGIEPVTIVTGALPTTKITNTIYWTTDGKVYRWVGSSYSKATDGADITANSITAGQIAAGAIGADQIAANAITTGKLLVTGQGASAWLDPNFADPSAWQVAPWHGFPVQGTVTDGVSGGTTLRSPTGSGASAFGARRVPVVVGRRYRCSVRARRSADANGTFYFRLDADTTATGGYSQIVASVEGATPGTSWTYYSFEWVATYPWVSPMVLVNFTGTAGWMEAQAIRIEEKTDADLIVDGAIIASKIAAGAIAVGSAAIADGAIRNALIENLAVDNAKIASMSVAKLLAGSLAVGQYIRSTSYVPGSSGWTINADGSAEFGANYIRGQLVASQIDTRNLTIKDGSGNVLFGAGTNLAASYITPASGWLNSNISLSSTGALTGGGGGQIVSVPVRDDYAERGTDRPPSWYPVGTTREFKASSAVGLGGADNYLTLETVIQYADATGGACYQYAYRGTTTWRRWGTCSASSWEGAWVQDLDRNAYTGDLNATYGASWASNITGRPSNLAGLAGSEAIKNGDITITVNPGGTVSVSGGPSVSGAVTLSGLGAGAMATINQITSANVSTYIASAAINLANINVASIGTLSALSSYLGAVEIATGGYLRSGQTAWSTGSGFWLGWIGSGPGEPGFSIGDSSAYLRYRPSVGLEIKLRVASGSISASTYSNVSNGINRSYGYCTASVTDGTAPYTYAWSVTSVAYDNGDGVTLLGTAGISSSSGNRADFFGNGTNAYVTVGVQCIVTDDNGLSRTLQTYFTVEHGTYSPT